MLPCDGCSYRKRIPGDAHIACMYDWAEHKPITDLPRTKEEWAKKWFMFPINYDPVWGPDECVTRTEEKDPPNVRDEFDPMAVRISLIQRQG